MRSPRSGPNVTSSAITPEAIAGSAITLVSHDAGGADLVSRLARAFEWDVRVVVEGPAVRIFDEVLGSYAATSLDEALEGADILVTGSGWSSTLEYDALLRARACGLPSVTVLDHWVNYTTRLTRDGRTVLPDTVWVTDDDALRLAREAFVDIPIVLVPNFLMAELREQFADDHPQSEAGDSVLVVCEPISDHYPAGSPEAIALGYDEMDALAFLLANITLVSADVRRITIRPHPAEPVDKYMWAIDAFAALPIEVSKHDTIISAVGAASIVAGCESMAMVLGLVADRRVVSMIPPGGCPSQLPQASIESLADLVNGQDASRPKEY